MRTLCLIRDIYFALQKYETQFKQQFGMSLNEGLLICALEEQDQFSSGEIAEKLGLTNPTASKIIKSVEDKGMIKRFMGNTDKRRMYFSLTDKGRILLRSINNRPTELPRILQTYIELKRDH